MHICQLYLYRFCLFLLIVNLIFVNIIVIIIITMRNPCCEKKVGNRGPWTKQEDDKLIEYIRKHGEGCWRLIPQATGMYIYITYFEFDIPTQTN